MHASSLQLGLTSRFSLPSRILAGLTVALVAGRAHAQCPRAWAEGVRTVVRLAAVAASGGSSHYPNAQQQPVSVRGGVIATGTKRSYQAWYRNAVAFCTPSTFNLSNGVEVTWGF